jgi:hypothetical protein
MLHRRKLGNMYFLPLLLLLCPVVVVVVVVVVIIIIIIIIIIARYWDSTLKLATVAYFHIFTYSVFRIIFPAHLTLMYHLEL